MTRPQLTLACTGSDRTLPLIDGRVQIEGADVRSRIHHDDLFREQARHATYDIAEFSACTLMALQGQGARRLVGIPVFPSRNFRHSGVFVHARSGIERPEDLVGRRVGCAEWVQTAALWIRAFLKHDYGIEQEQIRWVLNPVAEDRIEFDLPPNVSFERAPAGSTLEALLGRGEIDALISATTPHAVVQGSPSVRRLFPNYKEVEQDYYRRTGFFPIMHLVVIRRDVYEANPWLARAVQEAFTRARDLALETVAWSYIGILTSALPFLISSLEETKALMGDDYWPYGYTKNRRILEAMTQYAYEQGITPRRLALEDLFAAETLAEA